MSSGTTHRPLRNMNAATFSSSASFRPVVIAFAHQVCEAVRRGKRHIDQISRDIEKFRDAVATELCPNTHTWSGYANRFRQEVRDDILRSPEWLEHLDERVGLTPTGGEPGALDGEDTTAPKTSAPPINAFRRDGDGWRVAFMGEESRVKDLRGMSLIHCLVAAPNREFSATELLNQTLVLAESSAVSVTGYGDLPLALDAKALRASQAELKRLTKEMELARESGNKDLESELGEEFLQLIEQTNKDTDHRGRSRPLGSEPDKARKSAWAALNRARERICRELPDLAAHLHDCIHTGRRLSYQPDIDITWLT